MNDAFAFSEIIRKLANIIRIGTIHAIDGHKVKVKIGRIITKWLPIVSSAGSTNVWTPIAEGEQVAVFSPYGESAQGFVLRSIAYNKFPTPTNTDTVSLETPNDVKLNSNGTGTISFENGLDINVGGSYIRITPDNIILSCGNSKIKLTPDIISLDSGDITSNPPICKCGGI